MASDFEKFQSLKRKCDGLHTQYMELKKNYEELEIKYETLKSNWNATNKEVMALRKERASEDYSNRPPRDKYESRNERRMKKRFTKTDLNTIAKKYGIEGTSKISKEDLCGMLQDIYDNMSRDEKDVMYGVCATILN